MGRDFAEPQLRTSIGPEPSTTRANIDNNNTNNKTPERISSGLGLGSKLGEAKAELNLASKKLT